MNESHASETLKDIRSMMEKSSRFISLSGLSGIAAGLCALIGAYIAYEKLDYKNASVIELTPDAVQNLVILGVVIFAAAFISAFLFTYLRSKQTNVPIWGTMAKRVMVSVAIPMAVGALVTIRLIQSELFVWLAPSCLLFYGLALLNASKYTYPEIKYLSVAVLILGCINLWYLGYGLYFWALGFGVLHIIYGAIMWARYERETK